MNRSFGWGGGGGDGFHYVGIKLISENTSNIVNWRCAAESCRSEREQELRNSQGRIDMK